MINPIQFDINERPEFSTRGTLIEVHLADLHFGAPNVPPLTEYNILVEQCLNKIKNISFDIMSINGDIFHKKFPSNSDVIMYAMTFIGQCVYLCREKNATLVILNGTNSHDADQIKLFKPYMDDDTVDVRIIEQTQFIYVKGAKILCITEEYNKGIEYYEHFLYLSGSYDSVFMHGAIKGSIYGCNEENLDSNRAPVFSINSFSNCKGPIIAGHVHVAGCYETYMYYCSSPMRFQHGEEEDKGFLIVLHNLDTRQHYVHFETIESFRYSNIDIDGLMNKSFADPNIIVSYLDNSKASGIDFIKVNFSNLSEETIQIVKSYYKQNQYFTFKDNDKKREVQLNATEEILQKYSDMDFLLNPDLNEYEKFVRFINYNKGSEYITVQQLKDILSSSM